MNLGNLSWRYMKANKRRTILTILAIILSVALVTAVGLTFESSVKMMRRQFEATDGSWFAQVRGVSVAQARDIQKNVAVRQSGIRINELSAPIGPLPNYMLESRGEEHPFNKLPEDDINNQRVLSIMEMEQSAWDLLPYELVEGRRPESDSELVLDRASLEVMGLQVGDSVTLNTGFRYDGKYITHNRYIESEKETFVPDEARTYLIVGVVKEIESSSPTYRVQYGITAMGARVPAQGCRLFLNTKPGVKIVQAIDSLPVPLTDTAEVVFNNMLIATYFQGGNMAPILSLGIICVFVCLLVLVAMAVVIRNAFGIMISERTQQYALLRCVGASPRQIKKMVYKEASLMGVIGSVLGLGVGILAMAITFYFVRRVDLEFVNDLHLVVGWMPLAAGFALGMLSVWFSARMPARMAARTAPVDAVRGNIDKNTASIRKVKKARVARALGGTEGMLAQRNAKRNKRRFRVTVISMAISITLFIVINGLINSLVTLGGTIAPDAVDFMISSRTGVDHTKLVDELRQEPSVQGVYAGASTEVYTKIPEGALQKDVAALYAQAGMSTTDIPLYIMGISREEYDALKIAGEAMDYDAWRASGKPLMIANTAIATSSRIINADAISAKAGDTFDLYAGDETAYRQVQLAGVVRERPWYTLYGNSAVEVCLLVPQQDFLSYAYMGEEDELQRFIQVQVKAKQGQIDALRASMEKKVREYGNFYNDIAANQAQMRNLVVVMKIFLYGFVVVVSIVCALSILNTVYTNLMMRKREMALMRAVGMSRGQMRKMVLLECLHYSLSATFWGGLAGTVLLNLIQPVFTGAMATGMHILFPWQDILFSALVATVIAVGTAMGPIRSMSGGSIVDDIRAVE